MDDQFLSYLKNQRLFYQQLLAVFGKSKDPASEKSALLANFQLELVNEIISQYERFVKEIRDVANSS